MTKLVTPLPDSAGPPLSLGAVSARIGAPSLAQVERRASDWIDPQTFESQAAGVRALLDPALRQVVSVGWRELALRLHRGVVDGSRLTLELMGVGAPAQLLDRAEGCCSELTDVAARAFAVASAYAGEDLSPGGLEAAEPLRVDPVALVLGVFYEGFFGGEIALRVHEHWRKAGQRPEIAEVLDPICVTAGKQLELARDIVEWLLSGSGAAAIAELDTVEPVSISWEGLPLLPTGASDPQLQQRGLLAPDWLAGLARECLSDELPRLRAALLKRVTH